MAEMITYDQNADWTLAAGRANINRLFLVEIRTMADNHRKNAGYRRFRRQALDFYEMNYTTDRFQYDAWVPCVAITLVDRYHVNGGDIPIVVHDTQLGQNKYIFLASCLMIAMMLRNNTCDVQEVLRALRFSHFSDESVRVMKTKIYEKLHWDVYQVTPFCFIQFLHPFINRLPNPHVALYKIYELLVKSYYDIDYTRFRPSILAVSATLIVAKEFSDDTLGIEKAILESKLFMESMVLKCCFNLSELHKLPPCVITPGEWPSANNDNEEFPVAVMEIPPPQQRGREIQAELGWIEAEARSNSNTNANTCCSCCPML